MTTIESIRETPEYTDYLTAAVAYHTAWTTGRPAEINHTTDVLYGAYDRLARVCDHYVHLTDQCRRDSLIAARRILTGKGCPCT